MSARFARARIPKGLVLLSVVALAACPSDPPTNGETPTISITITPTSASVEQGSSTDVSVTVTGGGGFTGSATVSVEGLPTDVSGTVGNVQSSGGTTTATVTIDVGAAVTPGNYNITVRATGSGVSAVTVTFALTVTAAPAYQLTATPNQLIIEQAMEGTSDIAIARTNFTGDVTLAVEGAPSGMTTSFDVNPVSGNAAVLTIAPDGSVAANTYDLTVRGTATGLADRTATVTVMVTEPAAPDYMLGVNPSALSINQGRSEDAAVTVTRSNFSGAVTLAAEGVPADVSVSFSENPVTSNSSDMTVSVGATAQTGAYQFTVRGTATGLSDKTVTVDLTVEDASTYTLALNPTAISIDQGASGDVDVTITRTNFTEDVTLSLEGAPAGVTSQFSVNPVSGTASVLTVTVGAAVIPGDYSLTVRGTTTSLSDETETLTLTVTQSVGFSLDPITGISIQQNSSGTRTVTITRTGGFAGDVTVTVTDLPAGITATVNPVTTAGNSVDVTLTVAGTVAVGNYSATVRGNATGEPESTQTLDISVTTGSGQQVTLDFGQCVVDERPIWLAYQDGSGPWTPLSPTMGDTYTFNVSAATAGIAAAIQPTLGGPSVFIYYATQAEFVTADLSELCDFAQSGKTVNATVSGIEPANFEGAAISFGDASAFAFTDGPVVVENVPDGLVHLVGYKWSAGSLTSRMLIDRNLNPADNSDYGTIDFAGTGAFDPASATITVSGGPGLGTWFTEYATSPAGVCYYADLDDDNFTGPSFSVGGAPEAVRQAGEYHVVTVIDGTGGYVSETFGVLQSRTIAFAADLPPPTITDITGTAGYRRIRAEVTLPAEYASTTIGLLDDVGNVSLFMFATPDYLGGQSVSLEVPDFTGLSGWDDSWAPTNASTSTWSVTGFGWTGDDCTEGAREVARSVFGSVG